MERAQRNRDSRCFSYRARVGLQGKLVRDFQALRNLWALLEHIISYILFSPVESDKKLTGFAKNFALVVSGIRLIYWELFFRPGPSSRVGNPFKLYLQGLSPHRQSWCTTRQTQLNLWLCFRFSKSKDPGSYLTVSAMLFAVKLFSVMLAKGLSAPQHSTVLL